jgi:hypothetical protein
MAGIHGEDGAEIKGEGNHKSCSQGGKDEGHRGPVQFLFSIMTDDFKNQGGGQFLVFLDNDFCFGLFDFFLKMGISGFFHRGSFGE